MCTVMMVGDFLIPAAQRLTQRDLNANEYRIIPEFLSGDCMSWKEIRNQKADIAVIDIESSDFDGFELIERCSDSHMNTACIAYSASGSLGPIHRAFRLGAVDYIIGDKVTQTGFYECLKRVQAFVTLHDGAGMQANKGKDYSQPVVLAREYVQAHYREKLTLSEVAKAICISKGYLSSLFKKETGTNVSDFISKVKIEKAKTIISEGKYLMYEIAEQLGFENAYYFSKVFKKQTGYSPREYDLRLLRTRITPEEKADYPGNHSIAQENKSYKPACCTWLKIS